METPGRLRRALVEGRPGLALVAKVIGAHVIAVESRCAPPYLLLLPQVFKLEASKLRKRLLNAVKRGVVSRGAVLLSESANLPGEEVTVADDLQGLRRALGREVCRVGLHLYDAMLIYVPYIPGVEFVRAKVRGDIICQDLVGSNEQTLCTWYIVNTEVRQAYILPEERAVVIPLIGETKALVVREIKEAEDLLAILKGVRPREGVTLFFPPKGSGVKLTHEDRQLRIATGDYVNAAIGQMLGSQTEPSYVIELSPCFKLVM